MRGVALLVEPAAKRSGLAARRVHIHTDDRAYASGTHGAWACVRPGVRPAAMCRPTAHTPHALCLYILIL